LEAALYCAGLLFDIDGYYFMLSLALVISFMNLSINGTMSFKNNIENAVDEDILPTRTGALS
jgi:hypothetical protein